MSAREPEPEPEPAVEIDQFLRGADIPIVLYYPTEYEEPLDQRICAPFMSLRYGKSGCDAKAAPRKKAAAIRWFAAVNHAVLQAVAEYHTPDRAHPIHALDGALLERSLPFLRIVAGPSAASVDTGGEVLVFLPRLPFHVVDVMTGSMFTMLSMLTHELSHTIRLLRRSAHPYELEERCAIRGGCGDGTMLGENAVYAREQGAPRWYHNGTIDICSEENPSGCSAVTTRIPESSRAVPRGMLFPQADTEEVKRTPALRVCMALLRLGLEAGTYKYSVTIDHLRAASISDVNLKAASVSGGKDEYALFTLTLTRGIATFHETPDPYAPAEGALRSFEYDVQDKGRFRLFAKTLFNGAIGPMPHRSVSPTVSVTDADRPAHVHTRVHLSSIVFADWTAFMSRAGLASHVHPRGDFTGIVRAHTGERTILVDDSLNYGEGVITIANDPASPWTYSIGSWVRRDDASVTIACVTFVHLADGCSCAPRAEPTEPPAQGHA
jgi:hypothetical protein